MSNGPTFIKITGTLFLTFKTVHLFKKFKNSYTIFFKFVPSFKSIPKISNKQFFIFFGHHLLYLIKRDKQIHFFIFLYPIFFVFEEDTLFSEMDHHEHHMHHAADMASTVAPRQEDHSDHSDHGASDGSHMMMMYVSMPHCKFTKGTTKLRLSSFFFYKTTEDMISVIKM